MSNIVDNTQNFTFENLSLGNTQGMQGGGYFSKLHYESDSFLVQTPSCFTKKGICRTGKKIYCDLKFNHNDKKNSDFIDWLSKVEDTVRDLIYDNRDEWFHEPPTKEDIEYIWNSSIRNWKKTNTLVRTYIQKPKHNKQFTISIYDENEDVKTLDDITEDSKMITIVEILGVKWTSQSAQLDICLRQVMLIENKPIFQKCLIRNTSHTTQPESDNLVNTTDDDVVVDTIVTSENKEQENDKNDIVQSNNIFSETSSKTDLSKQDAEVVETTSNTSSESLHTENSIQLCIEDNHDNDNDKDDVVDNDAVDLSSNIVNTDKKDLVENSEKNEEETSPNENVEKSTENVIINSDEQESTRNMSDNLEKNDTPNSNEITIDLEPLEKSTELHEVNIDFNDTKDSISLKNPNEVYIEIYREAKNKARTAKRLAIQAYLEAKRIKSVYLLDQLDSDSESDDEYFFSENE